MTANESPTVCDVFELLNRWRHLPFYSLETRAAPFFAVFLRDVLRAKFGTEMHETVIPEFPLHIGSLYTDQERGDLRPKPGRNQSFNVDYVAFAKDKSTAYLVELKTDMGSKRHKQDKYLCKARDTEFGGLVEGVRELAKVKRRPNKRRKYFHLLHLLFAPGPSLLTTPDSPCLDKQKFRKGATNWSSSVDQLEIDATSFQKTKVVFVQPTKDKSECDFEYVDFDEVAKIVETKGELGKQFARCVRQWTKEAGCPDPSDIHRS